MYAPKKNVLLSVGATVTVWHEKIIKTIPFTGRRDERRISSQPCLSASVSALINSQGKHLPGSLITEVVWLHFLSLHVLCNSEKKKQTNKNINIKCVILHEM